jgi:adhesin HecA-like repeat protein
VSVRFAMALLLVTSLAVLLYAAGPYAAPPNVTVPANDVITAVGVPAMQANTGGTITAPGPVTATSNVVDLLANGGSIDVTNGTLTSTSSLSIGAANRAGVCPHLCRPPRII